VHEVAWMQREHVARLPIVLVEFCRGVVMLVCNSSMHLDEDTSCYLANGCSFIDVDAHLAYCAEGTQALELICIGYCSDA
jgi:hypothetical protein